MISRMLSGLFSSVTLVSLTLDELGEFDKFNELDDLGELDD